MNAFINNLAAGATLYFGIYDADGNRLISSGPIPTTVGIQEAFLEVTTAETVLLPSSLYLTGVAATGGDLALRNILIPSIPLSGRVSLPPTGSGDLRASFNFQDIEPRAAAVPISIAL